MMKFHNLFLNHSTFLWLSFVILLAIPVTVSEQRPLWSDQLPLESDSYQFSWPIHKVAVIGAGPSGLVAYRDFAQAGFDVWLFERDAVPGGTWHYTEEADTKTPMPDADISIGDFVPSFPPEGVALPHEEHYEGEVSEETLRVHRAPKPIWKSLRTSTPPQYQEFPQLPWPAGEPLQLPHHRVAQYIRAFASFHGINSNDIENPRIHYNTRVELVERRFNLTENGKVRSGWTLTLKEMVRTGRNTSTAVWTKEDFDAVVVATGRYNAPHVPDIPGLHAWADQFPDRVIHSRQYRRPQPYADQTVLIVGGSDSATQMAIDIAPYARHIYQSVRGDQSGHPIIKFLPSNVTILPEIGCFSPPEPSIVTSRVEFVNGTSLNGIDSILFATGYRHSFPFLPQFHNSSRTDKDNDLSPIITDGTHLRNLYLDILSIDEPTLGFMGMNMGIPLYQYSEYISIALSKVWGNQAKIPTTPQLWKWYEERQSKKGYGKNGQFLGLQDSSDMIRFFVGWLNDAAVKYGGRQVNARRPGDLDILVLLIQARYGIDIFTGADEAQIRKKVDEFLYSRDW